MCRAPCCSPLQIAIAPTVMLLDFAMFRKTQSFRVCLSVFVVCAGVSAATITDQVAIANAAGLGVGLASVVVTALYQIWAGSKQKELQANSSQLLQVTDCARTPALGRASARTCMGGAPHVYVHVHFDGAQQRQAGRHALPPGPSREGGAS